MRKIRGIILAQPKSASTSLMATIGQVSGLPCGQQFYLSHPDATKRIKDRAVRKCLRIFGYDVTDRIELNDRLRDIFPALDYRALSFAHSDIADFGMDKEAAQELVMDYVVPKQHFPPTEGNVDFFSGIPKLILTRSVPETIDSYRRMPNQSKFKVYLENPNFVEKLEREIWSWQEGWWTRARDNQEFILLDFDELIQDPQSAVTSALEHFNIDAGDYNEKIVLAKKRYYRNKGQLYT